MAYLDPAAVARVEEARELAYREGLAEGARKAEAAARRSAEAATARLRSGVEQARRDLQALSVENVPALVSLAVDIARKIVADVPGQVVDGLKARIEEALALLDDVDLVLAVSESDHHEVAPAFAGTPGLRIVVGPDLGTGDARIDGTWAHADLTLGTAWRLLAEELGV
jgi:flagellar biosynthesis/type III secretory pathway protein FliH